MFHRALNATDVEYIGVEIRWFFIYDTTLQCGLTKYFLFKENIVIK